MAFDTVRTPAGNAERVLGGSVNYFSVAASFYSPVQVVGVVGEDFPTSHLDWLQSRHIDVSGVSVAKGKTFHWVGEYDNNLNEAKTLSTALNVFEHFDPKLSTEQRDCSYVFLANIDPVLQQSVLDQMKGPKLVAADSMNFWITGKPEELRRTLRRVDILSINEGEAALLSGQKNIWRAAEVIRGMGPSVIVIKRGEYGAALFSQSQVSLVPAYPAADVVDPTGAGDTFAGAFMGWLARHGVHRDLSKTHPQQWAQSLHRAVVAGCVMASYTIEDFSLNRLMRLEPSEIENREKKFLQMIQLG